MTVIATAGHVDHGKSTLVTALTGTDPDRLAEEKQRGLTIDLGFAGTTLPSGESIAFVDVPGHARFLGNMLAGVGAADAAMFVVAATEGWMPQSEEHLRILELLGVKRGLIVVTKGDLVDDETRELALLDVEEHVEGTFLEGAAVVVCAAPSGDGIGAVQDALAELVGELDASADRGRPQLWIDRSFAAKGSGTVVTGTLTGGSLRHDDRVVIEPGAHIARIRRLESLGHDVAAIGPGNRVAVNLNGVDHHEIGRGDVLIEPDRWHTTAVVDASLHVLDSVDHPVSRRGAYIAHIGSRQEPVQLRVLGTDELDPGTDGFVRLHLASSLPLLPGDRFVVRESGRRETIGGGEVLDVDPRLRARDARPDRSIDRVIAERGWVSSDELERLTGERHPPVVGRWLATPERVEATRADLVARVEAAGPLGLELAPLEDYERDLVAESDEFDVDGGRVRAADAVDPLADHPLIEALRSGGFTPEQPTAADRPVVRDLAARGELVERDSVVFHRDAIAAAASVAASLLDADPAGFTVSAFRDATGTSRKFALPLVAELDARGMTRRRGDLRIVGPRLPDGRGD